MSLSTLTPYIIRVQNSLREGRSCPGNRLSSSLSRLRSFLTADCRLMTADRLLGILAGRGKGPAAISQVSVITRNPAQSFLDGVVACHLVFLAEGRYLDGHSVLPFSLLFVDIDVSAQAPRPEIDCLLFRHGAEFHPVILRGIEVVESPGDGDLYI